MSDPCSLIQRLAEQLKIYNDHCPYNDRPHDKLLAEASTYLDRCSSNSEKLSDKDLDELEDLYFFLDAGHSKPWRPFALSVLDEWGSRPLSPISLTERLPGPEDCDAEGRCWQWDNVDGSWFEHYPSPDEPRHGYWLPHHALPVPSVQPRGAND